MGNEVVIDL